ncbi:hypothetical protein RJ640_002416 [Escallonia rubra]|uniref:Uncharacterized protein n=1 Tax=Escallonia rubra TaxID=112253 RepID=A0AA88UW37_9ASTE|nr:hypothetical protein RJ640_002416 [Escallonia rubra]
MDVILTDGRERIKMNEALVGMLLRVEGWDGFLRDWDDVVRGIEEDSRVMNERMHHSKERPIGGFSLNG